MDNIVRRGNLIFLKSHLADLFYLVKQVEGEVVRARKMDAPPSQVEELELGKVVKIAEEQEKLFPVDLIEAIEKQRKITLLPSRSKKRKKVTNLDKLMEELPREGIEEILATLASFGVKND